MTKESKAPREFMVLLAQSPDEEDRISSKIFDPTKMKNPNWEHVIEYSYDQQLEEKLNYYKDHAEMMKEAWDKAEEKLRVAVEERHLLLQAVTALWHAMGQFNEKELYQKDDKFHELIKIADDLCKPFRQKTIRGEK